MRGLAWSVFAGLVVRSDRQLFTATNIRELDAMRKHDWQRQLQFLSTTLLFLLGVATSYGESAAPIPGFPEDLTLRAARAANAPAEPPSIPLEEVPAYVAWRENVKHFASVRVAYDYQGWTTPDCPLRKEHPELSDDEFVEKSKGYGWLRVSRSSGSLDREYGFQRYETGTRALSESPDTSNHERMEYINIHGDGAFYCYYPKNKSGAIWKAWRWDDTYPILEVLPPDPKNSRLVNVDESGLVLDFRCNNKVLFRYHLDPEHGMMPTRIEYHQIVKDGGLFLFRYYTVEAYSRTEEGVYVPSECTVHNCLRHKEDGTIGDLLLSTYTLTSFEEVEKFAPEEFVFTFPEGTRVADHSTESEPISR